MSPPGYPAELESEVLLANGRVALLRPILPDDTEGLLAFAGRLSEETVYLRFFSRRRQLSEAEARRFTTVDYADRLALVGLVDGELAAVARYERLGNDHEAEVAFTVRDDQQGRGLGTVMLEHLASAALARGIDTFVADTLPENAKMLGVFRTAGFVESARYDVGIIKVTMRLEPAPSYLERVEARESAAAVRSLSPLLEPKSVAIVGASPRPRTIGHELVANVIAAGFTGAVYPVHPTAPEVLGLMAYPSIASLPEPVDLAVIAVPAAAVAGVVAECGAFGCGGLVVVSAGFAEMGPEGAVAEREIVSLARRHGMRLIGPNCMGVINTSERIRLDATFAPVAPVPGRIAFCSQSGGLGVAILGEASRRGLGISSFVSVGNKADVSSNDLIRYWEEDPGTDVILLYLESFGNPRHFSRIARRVARRRPIVAVKAGRSTSGSRGTSSHTAAHETPDAVVDALFGQAGVIRVDTLEELFDVAEVVSHQPLPAGNRVAVLGNAGGPGVLAADACEGHGLAVPLLSEETQGRLRRVLSPEAGVRNPVDCNPDVSAESYGAALEILLEDPLVDSVIAIFTPPLGDVANDVATAMASAAARSDKPVLANFLATGRTLEACRSARRPIPWFAYPESAARALARIVPYAAWRAEPEEEEARPEGTDPRLARRILAAALEAAALDDAAAAVELSRDQSGELLACYGIALEPDPEGAMVPLPLGTGLASAPIVVGLAEDALFGPVVTFGLAGLASEVFGDRALRLPPISAREAEAMIRSIKAVSVLEGRYGSPAVDIAGLAELVCRLAALAEDLPEVSRLELSPVFSSLPGQGPDQDSAGGVNVLGARVEVLPVSPEPVLRRRRLR